MHSHHSHSGDYVLHAKDHLDDIVEKAVKMGFHSYCLTEHIPRNNLSDLYPEESQLTVADLDSNFDRFYSHARRLQEQYKGTISLLVGFETDYIRPSYLSLIQLLQKKYKFDMFVGSVHHVKTVPIDFDRALWEQAMQASGGTPEALYSAYFEEQYEMLINLHPPVVGHFDLIRLFDTSDSSKSPIASRWPRVWDKVTRNVEIVVEYGGLFELNSAAIRKGWTEPYPRSDIVKLILEKGGKFCFSDDSHGLAQIGLNFHKVFEYIISMGITEIYYLDLDSSGNTIVKADEVERLKSDSFWNQYNNL
ncbi:polymerase/histidinol phosphatase-like protein [Lipomyces oligophaga]|uniref:polymerase/histidinol phosphatase-like protein n=1 Tax=Lipomyces oligophaga TaxID=45792 RepID=UPI0034CD0650